MRPWYALTNADGSGNAEMFGYQTTNQAEDGEAQADGEPARIPRRRRPAPPGRSPGHRRPGRRSARPGRAVRLKTSVSGSSATTAKPIATMHDRHEQRPDHLSAAAGDPACRGPGRPRRWRAEGDRACRTPSPGRCADDAGRQSRPSERTVDGQVGDHRGTRLRARVDRLDPHERAQRPLTGSTWPPARRSRRRRLVGRPSRSVATARATARRRDRPGP